MVYTTNVSLATVRPTKSDASSLRLHRHNQPPALSLDHDPTSGQFRGWLCHNCNVGLGYLGDSVEALAAALDYLKGDQ